MRNTIVSLFVLLSLILGVSWKPAHAQSGVSVSVSAPGFTPPNTPVTITAEVTENGAPKSGVTVTFFVDGAQIGDCTTDALGKCQIGHIFGDNGEYTISASAEGSSDSTTIVVGGTNTPPPPPPTRTNTPLPPPTRTNTPISPTSAGGSGQDNTTPTRTPFFFNPSRTPTATHTVTPLNIPSSTPTSDAFLATPRIVTPTLIPTRTPRPASSGPIFAFPTISLENQSNDVQPAQTSQVNLSAILTSLLSVALIVVLILIIANFRRFRRLLWRLFRF